MRFDDHGVSGGCWTGVLHSHRAPDGLGIVHCGKVVARPRLQGAGDGLWSVAADLPGAVIEGGAHSLLLVAGGDPAGSGSQVLARLTLIAGTVPGDDLLSEVAQLRAELDLLKREFRRFAAGAAALS